MGVVSTPWSDLALLLRYITDPSACSMFPLWICGFVLFASVCLLLLQLITFFNWKLKQVEAEPELNLKNSALFRPSSRSAYWRRSSF